MSVRRVIVQIVMRGERKAPTWEMVRVMVRMERALSLRGLRRVLAEERVGA